MCFAIFGEWTCPTCRGTGEKTIKCENCKGTGKTRGRVFSSKCEKCKGNKTVKVTCDKCKGKGKLRTGQLLVSLAKVPAS